MAWADFAKKREYFENKLKENIAQPKNLWKTLKSLGLFKKISVFQRNAMEDNRRLRYDWNLLLKLFQTFLNLYLRIFQILLKNLI